MGCCRKLYHKFLRARGTACARNTTQLETWKRTKHRLSGCTGGKIEIMPGHFLQPDQILHFEELAERADSDAVRRRARILLLYHAGQNTNEISASVGLSRRTVQFWRSEFIKRGMDVFSTGNKVEPPAVSPGRIDSESPQIEAAPLVKKKKVRRKNVSAEIPFPKVRKNPGIKENDPMAEAGRKILRFHFAHMLAHEEGTRNGQDIEELHDMRVATRRMRAAFEVFGPYFRRKVVKKHLKRLRAAGRALGRMRDLDVSVEKAQRYLETLPEEERPGLDPLLNTWGQERTTERDQLLAYLDSENYQRFKQEFNQFVSTPGDGVPPITETVPTPNLVRHVVPVLIHTRLAALRAHEQIVTNASVEQLHALRIEFKRLRYAIEFFREVLGGEAREVIDEIKTLQDHLGDLNDANVACQSLREFIETWEERQLDRPIQERQNPEPVVAYLAARHAERHNLMITFPKAWSQFNRPDTLKNIALSISGL